MTKAETGGFAELTPQHQWSLWHERAGTWRIGRRSLTDTAYILLQGPTYEETFEYQPESDYDRWAPLPEGEPIR